MYRGAFADARSNMAGYISAMVDAPDAQEATGGPQVSGLPVVSAQDITPEEFQITYIDSNTPVVLTGATDHWEALTKCGALDGGVLSLWSRWSFEFFGEELGEQPCEVFLESRHRKGKKWSTNFAEYISAFDR